MNQMTPKQIKTINKLKQEITAARKHLNHTWDTQGCTNAAVLAAAAKLDTLFNQYQRIMMNQSPTIQPSNGQNKIEKRFT